MLNFLSEVTQTVNQTINDFFEKHQFEIYSGTVLVLFVDALVAIPFAKAFFENHLVRNFMVFGSPSHIGSFAEFAFYGIQWIAFVNIFLFLPAVIWSMAMPTVMAYVRKLQEEKE